MGNFDKTRERLNLNNLDNKDRKELFHKFVEHGGEVLKESSDRSVKIDSKQSSGKYSSSKNTDKNLQEYRAYKEKDSRKNSKTEDKKSSTFYNFTLWFRAFSNGVINFNGKTINNKFLNFIDKTAVSALLEMDTLIFNALNPASPTSFDAKIKRNKVISSFTDLDDLELLERVKDMYDDNVYKDFLRPFKELNTSTVSYIYKDDIKAIFRPLYILHLYVPKLKLAAEQALSAYAIVDNMSKSIVNARITAFKKAVDIIYIKYYPKLFILLEYVANSKLETSGEINNYLDIGEKDILGYYTVLRRKMDKLKEEKIDNIKENIGKDKDIEKLNKVVEIGLKLISKIVSYKKEDNSIMSEADHFYSVSEEDKIYRTKVLLDIVDREYSPVFISNKVKYNVIYDHQNRTDYQGDFNNIFLTLSDMHSRLNEYSDMVKNIEKIEKDKSMRFEQRANLIAEKNGQRSYLAKNLRNAFIAVINPLKKKLDKLLLDKEERERIIENPNDILIFDTSFGKTKKRVQGYTVIKALTEAYYFISGVDYLITEGELSGAGILIDGAVSSDNAKASETREIPEEEKTQNVSNDEEQEQTEDVNNLNIDTLEKHTKDIDDSI